LDAKKEEKRKAADPVNWINNQGGDLWLNQQGDDKQDEDKERPPPFHDWAKTPHFKILIKNEPEL